MKSNTLSPFASKLRILRQESGKSQEQLAKTLDISRSCLANYETGKRQPDNDMLVRIAETFHVLTDYLVDRTEFRNLTLDKQEISEFTRIKYELANHGLTLDLSVLNLQNRLSVFQYYDFLVRVSSVMKNSPFLP